MNNISLRFRILNLKDCIKYIRKCNKDGRYNNAIVLLELDMADCNRTLNERPYKYT